MTPRVSKLPVSAGILLALIGGVSAVCCTWARASDGIVIFAPGQCGDYFVVEDAMGDVLMEWYGGHTPIEGDRIVGDYDGYGFKDVFDVSSDSSIHVWIEDYLLSDDSAAEQLHEHC
jgi:hypothetical protein